jgi:uncharacterized membrane protein YbhN (UPF0104 family)
LALLGLVLTRINPGELKAVFGRVNLFWWSAGLGVFGIASGLGAWRWKIMLELKGMIVPWGACLRATLAGHFLNAIFLGPAGGDILKSLLFGRWRNQPASEVLAASWLDRVVAAIGSLVFAALTLAGVKWEQFPALSFARPASLWPKLIMAGLLLALIVAVALHRRDLAAFAGRAFQAWVSGLKKLAKAPHLAVWGVTLGFLVQLHLSSVLMLNLRAVNPEPLDWVVLFWTFPVISLLTALPLSISGLGIREGSAVVLLGLFGVPASAAVAASLLTLASNLSWAAGGAALLAWEEAHCRKRIAPLRPPPENAVLGSS